MLPSDDVSISNDGKRQSYFKKPILSQKIRSVWKKPYPNLT
jgi:hypothetical protein